MYNTCQLFFRFFTGGSPIYIGVVQSTLYQHIHSGFSSNSRLQVEFAFGHRRAGRKYETTHGCIGSLNTIVIDSEMLKI